jgi:hypothetical protein
VDLSSHELLADPALSLETPVAGPQIIGGFEWICPPTISGPIGGSGRA